MVVRGAVRSYSSTSKNDKRKEAKKRRLLARGRSNQARHVVLVDLPVVAVDIFVTCIYGKKR